MLFVIVATLGKSPIISVLVIEDLWDWRVGEIYKKSGPRGPIGARGKNDGYIRRHDVSSVCPIFLETIHENVNMKEFHVIPAIHISMTNCVQVTWSVEQLQVKLKRRKGRRSKKSTYKLCEHVDYPGMWGLVLSLDLIWIGFYLWIRYRSRKLIVILFKSRCHPGAQSQVQYLPSSLESCLQRDKSSCVVFYKVVTSSVRVESTTPINRPLR